MAVFERGHLDKSFFFRNLYSVSNHLQLLYLWIEYEENENSFTEEKKKKSDNPKYVPCVFLGMS